MADKRRRVRFDTPDCGQEPITNRFTEFFLGECSERVDVVGEIEASW